MKVNGFQVEEHGSGYQVTLRLHVGCEEAKEGMSDDATESICCYLAAALSVARGMNNKEDNHDADATDAGGREGARAAPDAGAAGAPAGRRRRGSRPASEAAASPAGEVRPDEGPTQPAPTAGRRSRRSKTAASAQRGQDATETSSGSGRRRKREKKKPTDDPTDAAPSAGRRSRGKGAQAAPASTTKSPSKKRGKKAAETSDEDLTRATSQAAQDLGPGAVMDVLEKFHVKEVRDLDQGQRADFVGKLQVARDAA